jgi:hypothetical protein
MTIVFEDNGSKIELTIDDDNEFSVRRPTKGNTPFLDAIVEAICDEELMGDDAVKAKNFLRQSEDMSVLIGEERCG